MWQLSTMGPLVGLAPISPPPSEANQPENSDLRARFLWKAIDSLLDAKLATSDQPVSQERNAPAGIFISGSFLAGLIRRCGRSASPLQHLRTEDGFTNAGISMTVVAYAVGTIADHVRIRRTGHRRYPVQHDGEQHPATARMIPVHQYGERYPENRRCLGRPLIRTEA